MTSQKEAADQAVLIKKLKVMITTLQRSNALTELKNRRQAQEIRELKSENAALKDKVRRYG